MDDRELALEVAHRGAAVVRGWMGRLEGADFKGEVDPVTEADRRSEAVMLELIGRHRPEDGILSEEAGGSTTLGRHWVMDPLDGTVNFLHQVPHVAVSVALFEGEQPLLGVVVDVFREEEFVATRGAAVELDGHPVRVTERTELSESLLATGFPYDRRRHGAEYVTTLGAVLIAARGVRRMGTAALDLAWVAAGRYDGFWEFKLGPWDVGAGMLLVEEAGGTLTDHLGDPYRLGGEVVVATNGLIHEELCRLVAENLPPHMRGG